MLLDVAGLTVTARAGERDVELLRRIDFTLEPGRVLGVVGESGAGKSMIARVIAGLLPAGFRVRAGRVTFEGDDLLAVSPTRRRALLGDRITFIPQHPLSSLNPVVSIGRQFAEHLAHVGIPRAERRATILRALAEVRLAGPEALLGRFPFQLSGGMCQRVLIAMAFASNPALIVADEPTTALDVTTQVHIVRLIRQLQAAHNTALLFITHDLRLAAHLCDDALVMYAGDVVERGPAKTVFSDPVHPYTRALRFASPSMDGERRRLTALPDFMPGLAALGELTGCRFAARCPVADPACAAAEPPAREIAPGHWVRCTIACAAAGTAEAPLAPASARAAPREAAALLHFDGVTKIYTPAAAPFRRRRPVLAVRNATLTIAPGEFVGLVGESGSGKSTVARLGIGLEAPTAGRIERTGTAQIVFQDPSAALNPRRRVVSLVTQALEGGRWSVPVEERRERAIELLRETALTADLAPRYPRQLSGGQRQRVNIARALGTTPRLLIADEIASGLDVSIQAQIINLLLRLREEHGIALLFISHDLAAVRALCERVLVMQDGEIVEGGTTEQVFRVPGHPYTRALLAAVPPEDLSRPWPHAEDLHEVLGA